VNHDRIEYSKKAYVYSALFHGALLLLMMNIKVFFEVEPPPFYELSLGSVSRQRMEQILEEARRAEAAQRLRNEGMTPQERVEVPKRRMIEIEEPTITVSNQHRIESQDIITKAEKQKIEVQSPSFELPPLEAGKFTMDRKEVYEGSKITVGEQPGAGIETGTIGADVANYTIEGEAKERKVIYDPQPEYTKGLKDTAKIRIAFAVLPDGTVSNTDMYPVRKANADLEEFAMVVLKTWRFSPLPEGDNRIQKGIITFEFTPKK